MKIINEEYLEQEEYTINFNEAVVSMERILKEMEKCGLSKKEEVIFKAINANLSLLKMEQE